MGHSPGQRGLDYTGRRRSGAARQVFATVDIEQHTGVIAIEGPGHTPAGWRELEFDFTDRLLGPAGLARMGPSPHAELLFSQQAEAVKSIAMVRIAIWNPARQGVLAFGSPDPRGFTADMGAELVAFLARVVERTAERWPAP